MWGPYHLYLVGHPAEQALERSTLDLTVWTQGAYEIVRIRITSDKLAWKGSSILLKVNEAGNTNAQNIYVHLYFQNIYICPFLFFNNSQGALNIALNTYCRVNISFIYEKYSEN